ncbi:MAG: tetratricopeptide repeat protein [Candidatus Zixiibacteriota bacterium]|jgi:tetratricopeptide (TPR) repeat protein
MVIWDYLLRAISYPLEHPAETAFAVSLAVVVAGLVYFFFKFNRDVFRTTDIIWVANAAAVVFIIVFSALVQSLVASAVMIVLFLGVAAVEFLYLTRRGTSTIALRKDARLAVFPFGSGTSPEEDWPTAYGVADILSRCLSGYDVGIMDPFRAAAGYVRRGATTEADVLEWGEALEADYLVLGKVRNVGRNVQVRNKIQAMFERREWRRPRLLVPSDNPFQAARAILEDIVGLCNLQVKNEGALAYYLEPTTSSAAWANYCEGRRYQISGAPEDLELARDEFQKALEQDEDFTLAAVGAVEIILQLARRQVRDEEKFLSLLEEAYRMALRAVRQRPELYETQSVMGEVFVFLSGGRDEDLFRRAQTRFLEAVRLNPNSARSWYNLALISKYSMPEEDVGYADFLGKAISADPSYITARLALGRHLDEKNDLEGARRQYRLALTYNPHNTSALNELGYYYLKRHDAERAAEILALSKDVDESNPTARYYLGMAQLQRGELAAAEEEFWAALAFKPQVVKYYRALAGALESGGKFAEAISVWEEALKRIGDEDEARKVRTHIGRLTDKVREAPRAPEPPAAPPAPEAAPTPEPPEADPTSEADTTPTENA